MPWGEAAAGDVVAWRWRGGHHAMMYLFTALWVGFCVPFFGVFWAGVLGYFPDAATACDGGLMPVVLLSILTLSHGGVGVGLIAFVVMTLLNTTTVRLNGTTAEVATRPVGRRRRFELRRYDDAVVRASSTQSVNGGPHREVLFAVDLKRRGRRAEGFAGMIRRREEAEALAKQVRDRIAATRPAGDVEVLADWLSGDFTSAAQAAGNPRFFEIELHVRRIWPERDGGPWLYVEQAAATAPDRPYRQRVYQVGRADDGRLVSRVYTLPGDPLDYAGAWSDPAKLDAIGPDDLARRDGCAVYLRRDGDRFAGGTEGRGCESTLAGAAYATSEVTVYADRLESLDRGHDADGEQVWGSEAGPYVFRRTEPTTRPAGRR